VISTSDQFDPTWTKERSKISYILGTAVSHAKKVSAPYVQNPTCEKTDDYKERQNLPRLRAISNDI